jgi:hypothetical protein
LNGNYTFATSKKQTFTAILPTPLDTPKFMKTQGESDFCTELIRVQQTCLLGSVLAQCLLLAGAEE